MNLFVFVVFWRCMHLVYVGKCLWSVVAVLFYCFIMLKNKKIIIILYYGINFKGLVHPKFTLMSFQTHKTFIHLRKTQMSIFLSFLLSLHWRNSHFDALKCSKRDGKTNPYELSNSPDCLKRLDCFPMTNRLNLCELMCELMNVYVWIKA